MGVEMIGIRYVVLTCYNHNYAWLIAINPRFLKELSVLYKNLMYSSYILRSKDDMVKIFDVVQH